MSKSPLRILAIGLIVSAMLNACASPRSRNLRSPQATEVIENYVAALNRRDLLALTAYVTPDIEWYTIVNGERILEVSGREALAASLQQYFARYSSTRWVLQDKQNMANYVAVTERSEWSESGRVEHRTSLGVFELSNGRIRRITYFLDGG